MECDICRTLAQQMRSYEMEIKDAREGLSRLRAGVTAASLLNSALEEASKAKLLYQRHRESFHKPDRSQSGDSALVKDMALRERELASFIDSGGLLN